VNTMVLLRKTSDRVQWFTVIKRPMLFSLHPAASREDWFLRNQSFHRFFSPLGSFLGSFSASLVPLPFCKNVKVHSDTHGRGAFVNDYCEVYCYGV